MKNGVIYKGYRLIISGSIVELLNYKADTYLERDPREIALARAKSALKRKINANAGTWWDSAIGRFFMPLFLTLTFRENLEDVDVANHLFKDFIKRFNYHIYGSKKAILKYVCVIEFQERGAVHYHCILFNVPYVKNLSDRVAEVWSHGFVMINSIKDVRNVGAYVVKYMTKQGSDDRLRGKKSYFTARGLKKSIDIKNDDIRIADYLEALTDGSLIKKFETEDMDYELHSAYNSVLRLIGNIPHSNIIMPIKESQGVQLPLDI